MIRRAVVLVLLVASARSVWADEPFAVTAYEQAEAQRKKGEWKDACSLYQASYDADQQLGVLLHLADCNEHIGRVASAWAEFRDAIDLARTKGDPREAVASKRAAALAAKISRLRLAKPSQPVTGLVVRRDDTDVTATLGTDLPIDPGDHVIAVTAPGFIEWHTKITIAGAPGTTQIPFPVLVAAPDAPVGTTPPVAHDGRLKITTQADATILFDAKRVGVGTYEATVHSGGHTLRIVAAGMRPYQSEVYVGDGEQRAIEVPLEHDIIVPALGPEPSFDVAASIAPGRKLHRDQPGVISYRVEAAFRLGARVSAGAFVDFGSIAAGNTCGFDMPGPVPANNLDYGTRYRLTSCAFVTPGVQVLVHVLPHRAVDPYLGVAAGYHFGLTTYQQYLAGIAQPDIHEGFDAVVGGARVGVDVHPTSAARAWAVGPYVDVQATLGGKESCNCDGGTGATATYASVFAGLRSSFTF